MVGVPININLDQLHSAVEAKKLVVKGDTAFRALQILLDKGFSRNPSICPLRKE
jgi:hypothetical protein